MFVVICCSTYRKIGQLINKKETVTQRLGWLIAVPNQPMIFCPCFFFLHNTLGGPLVSKVSWSSQFLKSCWLVLVLNMFVYIIYKYMYMCIYIYIICVYKYIPSVSTALLKDPESSTKLREFSFCDFINENRILHNIMYLTKQSVAPGWDEPTMRGRWQAKVLEREYQNSINTVNAWFRESIFHLEENHLSATLVLTQCKRGRYFPGDISKCGRVFSVATATGMSGWEMGWGGGESRGGGNNRHLLSRGQRCPMPVVLRAALRDEQSPPKWQEHLYRETLQGRGWYSNRWERRLFGIRQICTYIVFSLCQALGTVVRKKHFLAPSRSI